GAGLGIEAAPVRSGLDRSIRKIHLAGYVIRTRGLDKICSPPKRIASMNIRYADLDGDNAEEAIVEAVTCRSTDGNADVLGVFAYQPPDSVRELPFDAATPASKAIFDGQLGPVRLELIDGRLVRWFALDAGRCASGDPKAAGKRSILYRWTGKAFAVDRVEDSRPTRAC
ncbi:MAG: hypothetical protein H7125_07690, partial [Proteobacteria bacterium]|nr:hypothetical protein [Burkholderiales bacterium]